MAVKKIHALYTDDDLLMQAVEKTQAEKYSIEEVYTPFPVHGLDELLGLKPTRLAVTAFLYGLVGLAFAIWMTDYMMISDWPQNIGGKPSFSFFSNMPSFVVVMFEMTVFFSAHLMVITFYMRSRLWPFKEAENPDPRTTDDHFLVELNVGSNDEGKMKDFLEETGASEIKLIE